MTGGFQVPNTTPVPNEIINGWAMKLKGSELKVLLLVVRKTLGWIADPKTGMRKEEDWISYSQLKRLTGLSSQPLSSAIDSLCSKYRLIEIRDKDGNALDTAKKRMVAGRRRLSFFYRLNLKTLSQTSHYFENQNSSVLKSKTVTVLKSKSYKNNYITKTTSTKEYSSLKDLTENDLLEIAEKYKVPLSFVKLQLEKMINWVEAKGKRYKNYKRALMNWVIRGAEEEIKKGGGKYRAIDARGIK